MCIRDSTYSNDASHTSGGTYSSSFSDDTTGDTSGTSGNDDTTSSAEDFVCLLEDMKVMLNGRISKVTSVKVGDTVSYGTVTDVLQKHVRKGYYVINNELKITNDHPVLVNGNWKRTEDVVIGEYINNVKVKSIKYVDEIVHTVYIETDTEQFDVYCKNNIYTVHGQYKERLQKAS